MYADTYCGGLSLNARWKHLKDIEVVPEEVKETTEISEEVSVDD